MTSNNAQSCEQHGERATGSVAISATCADLYLKQQKRFGAQALRGDFCFALVR